MGQFYSLQTNRPFFNCIVAVNFIQEIKIAYLAGLVLHYDSEYDKEINIIL